MVATTASTWGWSLPLRSGLLALGVAASQAQALDTRVVTSFLNSPLFLTAPEETRSPVAMSTAAV
jgi:hypothetical protein